MAFNGTYAKTLYVSKTGLDTNDGLTPATAFLTLAKAGPAMQATGYNRIIVAPGTYSEILGLTGTGATGKYYHIEGDITSQYFTSITPGDVIFTNNSTANGIAYGFRMSNIKLVSTSTSSASTRLFGIGNGIPTADSEPYILNNVTFDETTTCSMSYLNVVSNQKYIHNNCTFLGTKTSARGLTYGLTAGSGVYEIEYNDCDFSQSKGVNFNTYLTAEMLGNSKMTFNRCSFADHYGSLDNAQYGFYFNDCNFYKTGAGTILAAGSSKVGVKNNSYMKNCNVYDASLNPLDPYNIYVDKLYYNYNGANLGTAVGVVHDLSKMFGLRVENLNGDGLNQIFYPDYLSIIETDELYDGKSILRAKKLQKDTYHETAITFKFFAEAGVPITLNIPLRNPISAGLFHDLNVYEYWDILQTTPRVNSGVTATGTWQVFDVDYTPENTGYHILEIKMLNKGDEVLVGEITIT